MPKISATSGHSDINDPTSYAVVAEHGPELDVPEGQLTLDLEPSSEPADEVPATDDAPVDDPSAESTRGRHMSTPEPTAEGGASVTPVANPQRIVII